jgi:hypothetical protein
MGHIILGEGSPAAAGLHSTAVAFDRCSVMCSFLLHHLSAGRVDTQ